MNRTPEAGFHARSLFVAIAVALAGCGGGEEKKPRERPATPVTVVEARMASVPIEVNAVGTVVPIATVDVGARVGGAVQKILFQEGAMVKKGDLLFEIDPEPYVAALAQAQAILARDTAQAENADAEAARYRLLLDKRLVAATEGEAKIAEAKAMRATLAADEAQVAAARLDLSWTKVTAPITGRADVKRISVGSVIAPNTDVVVTLRQLSPIQVSFALPQERLLDVQQLMKAAPLAVTAVLPDHPDVTEAGKLTFVAGSVDTKTGSIMSKADFDNAQERLWPGAFVRVLLTLGERKDAVVVPSAAVQPGQQGSFAFVIKDGKAEMRTVTVGPASAGLVTIESGITAGESVVVDGQGALAPGAKVSLKPPVGTAAATQEDSAPKGTR